MGLSSGMLTWQSIRCRARKPLVSTVEPANSSVTLRRVLQRCPPVTAPDGDAHGFAVSSRARCTKKQASRWASLPLGGDGVLEANRRRVVALVGAPGLRLELRELAESDDGRRHRVERLRPEATRRAPRTGQAPSRWATRFARRRLWSLGSRSVGRGQRPSLGRRRSSMGNARRRQQPPSRKDLSQQLQQDGTRLVHNVEFAALRRPLPRCGCPPGAVRGGPCC